MRKLLSPASCLAASGENVANAVLAALRECPNTRRLEAIILVHPIPNHPFLEKALPKEGVGAIGHRGENAAGISFDKTGIHGRKKSREPEGGKTGRLM